MLLLNNNYYHINKQIKIKKYKKRTIWVLMIDLIYISCKITKNTMMNKVINHIKIKEIYISSNHIILLINRFTNN